MNRTHTHYIYISGPEGMREPTGLLDWTGCNAEKRRIQIHQCLKQGELIAKLHAPVENMVQLRELLENK